MMSRGLAWWVPKVAKTDAGGEIWAPGAVESVGQEASRLPLRKPSHFVYGVLTMLGLLRAASPRARLFAILLRFPQL